MSRSTSRLRRRNSSLVAFPFWSGLLLLGATNASGVEGSGSAERCKILVLHLEGRGLEGTDRDLPALLTNSLAAEAGAVSGCDVISQADIAAMLNYEKQKAICAEGSDSCLAEIGQAMGADRVVAGTVGKLVDEYLVSARLLNVKQGSVDARAEQGDRGTAAGLRTAAKNVARRLFGAADLAGAAQPASSPHADGASPSPIPLALTISGGAGVLAGIVAGAGAALLYSAYSGAKADLDAAAVAADVDGGARAWSNANGARETWNGPGVVLAVTAGALVVGGASPWDSGSQAWEVSHDDLARRADSLHGRVRRDRGMHSGG